jgi:hypothetical protein
MTTLTQHLRLFPDLVQHPRLFHISTTVFWKWVHAIFKRLGCKEVLPVHMCDPKTDRTRETVVLCKK